MDLRFDRAAPGYCKIMALTLGRNIASLRGIRQLNQTSTKLGKVFERLSSGLRINSASDDAAGLAVAESLRSDVRIVEQGLRNLNDGISLLRVADTAVESLSNIVARLEELSSQAANGTYTFEQRKALDDEAQALAREFTRIRESSEFNGKRFSKLGNGQLWVPGGLGSFVQKYSILLWPL